MMLMYFREIMLGKRKGLIIRQILCVLSHIYLVLIKIRMCGYRYHLLQTKRLPVRVISVGNLTVGGSGKTPAIIEIASLLKDAGKRVGVLIRGYGGRYEHQQGVVSDGGSSWQSASGTENQQYASVPYSPLSAAENAGDEACLLARNLPGIPVLAGKNRWASGEYAVKEFGCDTLLLDDGFQHIRLYRDVDILLYDVSLPEQGLRLFPEGVLREPLYAAKRSRVIILTHTDMVANITPCMNLIKGLNPGALILTSIHLPLCLISGQGDVYPLSSISGKKILACSGIGCPESFEHSLRQFDPGSIIPLRFPDHHQYDSASIARIEEMARGVDMVVTTEKDMIRLENEMQKGKYRMKLFFLKMRLEIITPNWQKDLLRCLCND